MEGLISGVVIGAGAVGSLIALVGLARGSRSLLVLGATLLASAALSYGLSLLGLPVTFIFGFLGAGAFFNRAADRSPENPGPGAERR